MIYLVVLLILLLAAENAYFYYAFRKFSRGLEVINSIPATHLTFIANPALATCQFCKTKLHKIYRSTEGYLCCEACSRVILNQLPKEENVISFH